MVPVVVSGEIGVVSRYCDLIAVKESNECEVGASPNLALDDTERLLSMG